MIICFEGTPGSGKSYDAVKKVLDNLKLGRVVYTNIEGLDEQQQREFMKVYTGLDDYELGTRLHFLSPFEVGSFWKVAKPGSLVIIDEVHKFFNARDWSTDKNRECADWASTHRHHGYDVVLITQDAKKIDSQIRTLLEWTYRYKKMNFFGSLVTQKYLVYPYVGEGDGKPISKPSTKTYNQKIFNCYKSYVTKDIKELGIMKHVNILKHPIFYSLPVVVIFFGYLFMKSSFAEGKIIPGQNAAEKKLQGVVASQVPAIVAPAEKVSVVAPDGRIRENRPKRAVDPVQPVQELKRAVTVIGTGYANGQGMVSVKDNITGKVFMIDMRDAMQACNCEASRDLQPDDVLMLSKTTNAGTERAARHW